MHILLARLHRYAGLSMALFLVVAGLTGSIIAFHEEIDRALNPGWFRTNARGPALPTQALADAVQRALPGAQITVVPVSIPPRETARIRLMARTSQGLFDEAFVDPITGRILGTRSWGACCFSKERIVPFLYRFHYSLALPGMWGVLLMGGIALLWTFDCFTAFLRTLPPKRFSWRQWKKSWTIKRGASAHRFNVDLHRAAGLWLWALLLMLAVSGVALNLPEQIFRPLVARVWTLKPGYAAVAAKSPYRPDRQEIGYDRALAIAQTRLIPQGFAVRQMMHFGGLYLALYTRTNADGKSGLGFSQMAIGAYDGRIVNDDRPDAGSTGDRLIALQYPLHSGRLFGLTGRIAIALTGWMVAMLSLTGVLIWWRKKRGRKQSPAPRI